MSSRKIFSPFTKTIPPLPQSKKSFSKNDNMLDSLSCAKGSNAGIDKWLPQVVLASYVLLALNVFSATWIVFYTFNPSFIQVVHSDTIFPVPGAPPDPMKCFIFSVLVAAIVTLLLWIATRCGSE